jgi:protein-tyrosine-phosphatase
MRRTSIERNILFLCEDNACLSQIAEASAKHLAPPRTRIFSAGVKPSTIPTPALAATREDRDEIDKRVFALFLDHWRNVS